ARSRPRAPRRRPSAGAGRSRCRPARRAPGRGSAGSPEPSRRECPMPKRILMRTTLAALLLTLVLVPSANAYTFLRGRWQDTTITYYNEVPAYTWAVDTAAYAWNSSGAHVRFLKSSRRNAQVLLGVQWFRPGGETRPNVRNGRIYGAKIGIRNGLDRYT